MTTETPAQIQSSLVQEFVGVCHGDLDRVKVLLKEEPRLIHACWDWGGGDFETGLGAASHMGRSDIALFLLENGARMDIFAAAMLGELEVVRAMVEAHPLMREAVGPHGIPLIAHAIAGGEAAVTVVDYLR